MTKGIPTLGEVSSGDGAQQQPLPFRQALRYWIKLGFINFGGPAGQIAIMHRDIVEKRRWVSEDQFLRALNFCMLLPGPEAQQLATYIGWRLHGLWGGLAAGLWFILPSIFVLLGLSYLVVAHGDVTLVAGVLYGVQPVVVAIVAEAVMRIGRRTLTHQGLVAFAAAAFISIYVAHVPFPFVVLGAGVLGLLVARRWPHVMRLRGHASHVADGAPGNALPPMGRAVKIVALFAALWAVPIGAIVAGLGPDHLYTKEALFFTGAAFVTFGGAYAVLSYVADAAVNVYGWLDAAQMVHGLALAESTPGPLIMVTQYVGFLGGWHFPGNLPPVWSGIFGALIVTYVTFLPCFMFVFVGAPYVEALAGNRRLQAALVGVTSAVVGVILNLGVFFATNVLVTDQGRIDWFAAGLALASFLLLWRLRWAVHTVVIAGAAAGLAWTLAGLAVP